MNFEIISTITFVMTVSTKELLAKKGIPDVEDVQSTNEKDLEEMVKRLPK